jgi:hypothetical protein
LPEGASALHGKGQGTERPTATNHLTNPCPVLHSKHTTGDRMIKFYWGDRKKVFSHVGHAYENNRWAVPYEAIGNYSQEDILRTIRNGYISSIGNTNPKITYGLHTIDYTTDICYIDEREWYANT